MESFNLSDKFLEKYRDQQPQWGFDSLSYFVYKRTYSRLKEDGRQEEFFDTVQRCVEGSFTIQLKHCKKMRLPWDAYRAQISAQKMFQKMWEFKFLPPGRGLWTMGTPVVDKIGSAALCNCFSGDTKFFTQFGITRLDEAASAEVSNMQVQNLDGHLVHAIAKRFGDQELQTVTFKPWGLRTNHRLEYKVTLNHRWLLATGQETTSLSVGDTVFTSINTDPISVKDHDLGKVHGVIFGDGTRHTYYKRRFSIRLCDHKTKALQNILEAHPGYTTTSQIKGDPMVNLYSDDNLKEIPDDNKFSLSYLKGFLEGWLAADSHIGTAKHYTSYTLDCINSEAIEWLKEMSNLLGYSITGHSVENSPTNFGERTKPLQRLTLTPNVVKYVVESIEKIEGLHPVYCVQEPVTRSFTLAGGIATGNCGFISTKEINKDFSAPFAWAADMLMLGVGVGYDTEGAGKVDIPLNMLSSSHTHTIPDTREGWVESVEILLENYRNPQWGELSFDYSLVRPAGAPIAGFGGTASGPEPLKEGHENIARLLDGYRGKTLDSVGITDVMNYIGKFVVAGNVRRSAEIAIGHIDDTDFIQMKDYNLFPEELKDRRWMSNNSVFAAPDSDFSSVCKNISVNGEPGLIFMDSARKYGRLKDGERGETHYKYDDCDGFNPCAEQSLKSFELCNLVETFPANHDSAAEFYDTLKYAYLFAKSVTLVPTHCERTNQIMLQNRRIGCSQSGIQQAIKKFGIQHYLNEFCDKGYNVINNWDHIYSRWLGIPTSIKMTTVKPSGTVSILAGSTPGVHCTHSEYYYRTVRVAANSVFIPKLRKAGYRIEESVNDKKTLVVYFPVKEKNFTKSKFDISLWEQLTLVKELQYYWSDNAVSCTVTFKPEEAKDLQSAIEYFSPYVKTLSFLPLEDHNYAQAPYQAITEQEYKKYSKQVKKLNLKNEKEKALGEKYCSNDGCAI